MNIPQHIFLALCWVIFGLSHSLLAADILKKWVEGIIQNGSRFYRLFYSILAMLLLAYIAYYNFSITSIQLWHVSLTQKIIAIVTGCCGFIIMAICINKYFLSLSGFSVFYVRETNTSLRVNGLNAYMRHPLYTGTLLFIWALFLWQPQLKNLISCTCITLYTVTGTFLEERRLLKIFGQHYKNYAASVPMFIPKLFSSK